MIPRLNRQHRSPTPEVGYAAQPDQALIEFTGGLAPGRAADLGCGGGRNAIWLARHGWRVTAVDLSEDALIRLVAAGSGERLAIELVAADMLDFLGRGAEFELVVLANFHPPAKERAALLAAAAHAVSPGGHLFVIGHHLESLGRAGPPDPERLYTEARLAGAFPGLDVIRLERRERGGQEADASLIDLVVWAARPPRGAVKEPIAAPAPAARDANGDG